MAHLHNYHRNNRPSFLADVGNKIKIAAEVAGTAKGIYDIGKFLYNGVQTLAPMVATAGLIL